MCLHHHLHVLSLWKAACGKVTVQTQEPDCLGAFHIDKSDDDANYCIDFWDSVRKCLCNINAASLTRLELNGAAAAKSLQLCPTLCDPIDGSPPGSPVPGILQARTLEWAAISFSNAAKWKVKVKLLSCVQLLATPWTAAHQAPPSMGFSRQEYWSGVPLPWLSWSVLWLFDSLHGLDLTSLLH